MNVRIRLTQAGYGAIVIAVIMLTAGLMKTINLLVLLGDLLLVLIVINAIIAWRSTRLIRVEHVGEPDHFAGKASSQTLSVFNGQPRPAAVTIREQSTVHSWSEFVAALPVASSERLRTIFTPAERGVHAVIAIISSGYPFGFVAVERRVSDSESLIVYPALGHLDLAGFHRWLRHSATGDARSRRPVSRPAPQRADLRGVRPFRTGDSPRLIHWRTTARRNELMVREFDSPDAVDLVLFVESWLLNQPTKQDYERHEAMLSLAATLLDAWCGGEQSPRVTLIVAGRTEPIEGRASRALARKFFQALASVDSSVAWGFEQQLLQLRASRAIRLHLSCQAGPGPVAKFLKQLGGTPWQCLSPQDAPAWYHPPTSTD